MYVPIEILGSAGQPDESGALPLSVQLVFEDGSTYTLSPTIQLSAGSSFVLAGCGVHCDLSGDVAISGTPGMPAHASSNERTAEGTSRPGAQRERMRPGEQPKK